MAEIELVDVSLRDGNQSLWGATGLTTAMILQIAPAILATLSVPVPDYMQGTPELAEASA